MTTAEFLSSPALDGVSHGFFTRRGGVSTGRYLALNCSLNGGDDPALVAENRARCATALGLPGGLCGLHQVHGPEVVVLGRDPWPEQARPKADGVVTAQRGVGLAIVTADCLPILFADRAAGVVGACHAGWRGAVAGIGEATVAAMASLGADPSRIVAVLGPCIRQPSYEVAEDLLAAVLASRPDAMRFFAPGRRADRWQFDLPGYAGARLAAAGVSAVHDLGVDTFAEEERFFSYRRSTLAAALPVGHQMSVIALAD
jgi:YfiH family protein